MRVPQNKMCDECSLGGGATEPPPASLPLPAPTALKLVVVGDVSTGKTSLCSRFIDDAFTSEHVSTIGAAFASLQLALEPPCEACIWDTAGEERFRAMTRFYFRGTHAALAVYDATQPASLEHLADWVRDLRALAPDAKVVVVGNKRDLITSDGDEEEQGLRAMEAMGAHAFRLVSARTGEGVREVFLQAAMLARA